MRISLEKIEKQHLESVILKKGLNISNFECTYQWEPPPPQEDVFPLKGHVTVKRISTGKHKTYKTGHGLPSWVLDFEQDLNRGFFD